MTRTAKIKFDPQQLLDTVVGAVAGDGLVPDEHPDFAKERGDNQLIVVAAAPKAGSTFLVNTLMQVTGLRGFRLCSAYSTNEHDLYLPALCVMNASGCVSQLHMKGTYHNAALMRSFGIRPIILVRRIADMIIDLALPWFVNFYVSWHRLCEQGAVDALWLTYEELSADKEATLRR